MKMPKRWNIITQLSYKFHRSNLKNQYKVLFLSKHWLISDRTIKAKQNVLLSETAPLL